MKNAGESTSWGHAAAPGGWRSWKCSPQPSPILGWLLSSSSPVITAVRAHPTSYSCGSSMELSTFEHLLAGVENFSNEKPKWRAEDLINWMAQLPPGCSPGGRPTLAEPPQHPLTEGHLLPVPLAASLRAQGALAASLALWLAHIAASGSRWVFLTPLATSDLSAGFVQWFDCSLPTGGKREASQVLTLPSCQVVPASHVLVLLLHYMVETDAQSYPVQTELKADISSGKKKKSFLCVKTVWTKISLETSSQPLATFWPLLFSMEGEVFWNWSYFYVDTWRV